MVQRILREGSANYLHRSRPLRGTNERPCGLATLHRPVSRCRRTVMPTLQWPEREEVCGTLHEPRRCC